jgi:glycerol-3-phosphate dehydrogenase
VKRQVQLQQLLSKPNAIWDIIVIGGGATGLGIALDGVTRGFKTLLLEQADFAKGTSSRSTKLVHGGVRYMAQGDLFLVTEALHERGLMIKNAPHLTSNQEFIVPVYNLFDVVKYTVGLKFYDLLAGRLSLGKSHFLNRKNTLARLPQLKPKGLKGGIVYHDGQFDDSRMTIALAQSCVNSGGTVLNYVKVSGLLKNENGKIVGVEALDMVSGDKINVKTKLVINATGVFADAVCRIDNPDAKHTMKPSQGVHIVLDKSFLPGNSAIMIPETDDGRVLFAIPWHNEVVVGTTDTPVDTISLEPVALEKEINFILHTAEQYLVRAPRREDILSVFAGLRPLAANPDNPHSTKEVSRRHKITLSPSGLLTIVGGKWTTYRRMAEETINKAISAGFLENRKCVTADHPLTSLSGIMVNRFLMYGDKSTEIEAMILEIPALGIPIDRRLPYCRAEIIWICRNEMPVNIEDILARRTRALFLNAKASSEMAAEVASLMAAEFGFDKKWQENQIESYTQLVKNYI